MFLRVDLLRELDLFLEAYLERRLHVVCAKAQLDGGVLVANDFLVVAEQSVGKGRVEGFAEDRFRRGIFGRTGEVELEALLGAGDVWTRSARLAVARVGGRELTVVQVDIHGGQDREGEVGAWRRNRRARPVGEARRARRVQGTARHR